jgi:hypothetical protein
MAGWFGLPAAAKRVIVDPMLGTSRGWSRGDVSVIDGMVRAVAAGALWVSAGFRRGVEKLVDGAVWALAGGTVRTADTSRSVDEIGVDGAVEGVATAIGYGGEQSQRSQTGMSHDYYTVMVVGGLVAVAVAAVWR